MRIIQFIKPFLYKKLLIFILPLVVLIGLSYFLIQRYTYLFNTNPKKIHLDLLYKIPDIDKPRQVIWLNDNEIIINDDHGFRIYSLNSNNFKNLRKHQENTLIGIDSTNNYLYCYYQNFEITDSKDFATEISIYDSQFKVIKDFKLHPTIKLINCDFRILTGLSAYSFLEQNRYTISVDNADILKVEQVISEDKYSDIIGINLQGLTTQQDFGQKRTNIYFEEKSLFTIDSLNNFQGIALSNDGSRSVLVDDDNNLWIVEKNE